MIGEYETFSRSFTRIAALDLLAEVFKRNMQEAEGRYWPEPYLYRHFRHMSSTGTVEDLQKRVAAVAGKIFGASISAHDVIDLGL